MEGLGILALALVVPLALGGLGGGGGDDEAEQTEDTSLDELRIRRTASTSIW